MSWIGWIAGVIVVVTSCALAPSCVATSPGPSLVAQGQLYQSGDPLYDEFFRQLHTAQVAVERATSDEAEVRRELGNGLGSARGMPAPVSGTAGAGNHGDQPVSEGGAGEPEIASRADSTGTEVPSPDVLAEAVGQRFEEAKERAKARVDIDGEFGDEGATAVIAWVGKPRPSEKDLGSVVEDGLTRELQVLARMRTHQQQLERLGSMAEGLEKNVDSVFRRVGLSKRAEVKKNLRDAEAVIPLMEGRVQEVWNVAERTVRGLRAAATTAANEVVVTSTAPAAPEPAPPPPAPRRPAPRPRSPAAAPPPPAPAPASDFEP